MSMAPGGAATVSILRRMAVTAPVISSIVSPRTRNPKRKPPICAGVTSPQRSMSKARSASPRVRLAPLAILAMSGLKASISFHCAECWESASHPLSRPERSSEPESTGIQLLFPQGAMQRATAGPDHCAGKRGNRSDDQKKLRLLHPAPITADPAGEEITDKTRRQPHSHDH